MSGRISWLIGYSFTMLSITWIRLEGLLAPSICLLFSEVGKQRRVDPGRRATVCFRPDPKLPGWPKTWADVVGHDSLSAGEHGLLSDEEVWRLASESELSTFWDVFVYMIFKVGRNYLIIYYIN